MNAQKKKITSLFTTALVCSALFVGTVAKADSGTNSGGGGNSLKGHMIEEYLVEPYAGLPDFKASMAPFIRKLEQTVPGFASYLKYTIHKQNWYLIPAKINELPKNLTKLNFESDQPAYQTGTEIFIDQNSLKEMAPSSRAMLYQHEAIMATLHTSSEATRQIVTFFKKNPNFNPLELIDLLSRVANYTVLTKIEIDNVDSLTPVFHQTLIELCRSNVHAIYSLLQHNYNLQCAPEFSAKLNAARLSEQGDGEYPATYLLWYIVQKEVTQDSRWNDAYGFMTIISVQAHCDELTKN